MFSSKPIKIFVAIFVFTNIFSACGWWKNLSGNSNAPQPPLIAQEISSDLPFVTAEPENYQAEIVVTTFAGDEKSVRKTFVAKNATQHFITFNAGEKFAVSNLRDKVGGNYLISTDRKIYTENSVFSDNSTVSDNDIREFITTEWLNEKPSVSFEKLSAENNLSVFRADFKDGKNSEILIYFDENLKIPVKQEFYSVNGAEKTLLMATEIKNFRRSADEQYFQIPADYKKVSREEFDKIVRSEK